MSYIHIFYYSYESSRHLHSYIFHFKRTVSPWHFSKSKLSGQSIMLFTCQDDPHSGNDQKQKQARQKGKDLNEAGISLELLHMGTSFDVNKFYKVKFDELCGMLRFVPKRIRWFRRKQVEAEVEVFCHDHLHQVYVMVIGVLWYNV